jgi:hypothetical protein
MAAICMQIAAIMNPLHLAQFLLGMRVKKWALTSDRMAQKHLGRQARNRDAGFFQEFSSLDEGLLERHSRPS